MILQWLLAHIGIASGLGVAILDLLFAINPAWQSNGILHFIYLQLVKPPAPPGLPGVSP